MKKHIVNVSVNEAVNKIKVSLQEKGFNIFAEVDHQKNAISVQLELADSKVLIFGNPMAGTKLMQKDISISLDLPLRIAVYDDNGNTTVFHQTSEDFAANYQVDGHPVLEKIEELFSSLIDELS